MDQGRRVRSIVSGEIAKRRSLGQRFTVTFDEWTSRRNRRYMNVNVHGESGSFWSLLYGFSYRHCASSTAVNVIPGRPGILGMRTAVPEFPGMKKGVRE